MQFVNNADANTNDNIYGAGTIHIHHRHLLAICSPKDD